MKGRHAGKVSYYDADQGDRAVVYLGEPIQSGCVVILWGRLTNVTSLDHESVQAPRWARRKAGSSCPRCPR